MAKIDENLKEHWRKKNIGGNKSAGRNWVSG
jgi:hypothetical protein